MNQHLNIFENKIPENLKDYEKEYKYIYFINYYFTFIVCDIWGRMKSFIEYREKVDNNDYIKRSDILVEHIKDFLKKIEDKKLKDISNINFDLNVIFNIYYVKKYINYFISMIRNCYGLRLNKINDENIVNHFERNKYYLELFLSKINIKHLNDVKEVFPFLSKNKRLYFPDNVSIRR